MPRVWNMRDLNVPEDAVYVGRGRGSKWGNPYSHQHNTLAEFKVDTREEAVQAFADDLYNDPVKMQMAVKELAGKDLVCWCAPAACHADVLLEIANAGADDD